MVYLSPLIEIKTSSMTLELALIIILKMKQHTLKE